MDLVTTLPAFLLAVVFISASPGPALALITRRAALHGTRAAVPTILGLEVGIYLWALAAGAGLAALVAASETAYLVLRVVGAAVLIYLGVRAWRTAWADRGDDEPAAYATSRRSSRFAFGEGAVVQLANPKAAVFMFAFYPQFVPADQPLLQATALLALLQVAVETCLYLSFAMAVGRASAWFRQRRIRRRVEAASGTVLIGLGVRMAVDR